MKKRMFVVLLLVALFAVPTVAAQDATPTPEAPEEVAEPVEELAEDAVLDNESGAVVDEEPMSALDVLAGLLQLLEFVPVVVVTAPGIAAIVEFIKSRGFIPAGYAGLVAGLLNLVAWVVLAVSRSAGIEAEIEGLLALASQSVPIIIALLASIYGTSKAHDMFNGTGLFPKSKSAAQPDDPIIS